MQQEIVTRRELAGVAPGLFTISALLEVQAPIDAALLAESVEILSSRHETLRTTIDAFGDELRQRIGSASQVEFTHESVTYSDVAAAVAAGSRLVARPFDLQAGPLARVGLFRSGSSSVLAVAAHHVVADGWSLSIVLAEVAEIYQQRVAGGVPELHSLPVQYQDFARWQRGRLRLGTWSRSAEFWQARMSGLPSPPLPFEAMPLTSSATTGVGAPLDLGEKLSAEVRMAARRSDTTPFIVLLTAYRHALAEFAGCGDVAVGTTVANRNGAELEGLVGYFANTLIVRAAVPSTAHGVGPIVTTAAAWREAWAHRDLPLAAFRNQIIPLLRDEALPPYTAYFVMQPSMPSVNVGGAPVRFVEPENVLAKVPLALEMWDGPVYRGALLAPLGALSASEVGALACSVTDWTEAVVAAAMDSGSSATTGSWYQFVEQSTGGEGER